MSRLLLLPVLALGWLSAAGSTCAEVGSEHNTLSDAEIAEGWQLLFDGSSLQGWRNYQSEGVSAGWQARDGRLARVGDGAGDLVTEAEYASFELALEWRVEEGGNSGVFIRAGETERYIFMSAPEIQILDDDGHRDGQNPLTSAGSNYALHPAPRGIVQPAGVWNHVRVRVVGNKVTQWLNGRRIVDYQLGSDDWRRRVAASKFAAWPAYGTLSKGRIGLQDHGDPVEFRDIKLLELGSREADSD